jgi:hypothetical protein
LDSRIGNELHSKIARDIASNNRDKYFWNTWKATHFTSRNPYSTFCSRAFTPVIEDVQEQLNFYKSQVNRAKAATPQACQMLAMCVGSFLTYQKDPEKTFNHGPTSVSFKRTAVSIYTDSTYIQVKALSPKNPTDLPIMCNMPTNKKLLNLFLKVFAGFTKKLECRKRGIFMSTSLSISLKMAWGFMTITYVMLMTRRASTCT